MQPGDTITPQDGSDNKTPVDVSQEPAPKDPAPPEPERTPPEQESAGWQYNQDEGSQQDQYSPISIKPVKWSASEFIEHEKNSTWFMGLAGLTIASVVIIFLITEDLVTSAVIIIAAALFGVTAKRKPRTLQYQIDNVGVIIDGKPFPYDVFKSFSVLAEGAFNSIQLMPLKRFMPPISLYFPPENEEQIITTLGSYLPHEDRTHDPIERLMRRVRF